MEKSVSFGDKLRVARELAGMSQSALARKCGITRGTVYNIEEGITEPSPSTARRLRDRSGLKFDIAEHAPPLSHDPLFSPRYDPMALASEMVALLNGPGGTLEQTFAYIDTQSANDWYEYSNLPAYQNNFKAKLPVVDLANTIMKNVDARGLDFIALGAGDGKNESRLAAPLSERMGASLLRFYLLDISHPLLVAAYKHAVASVPPQVAVFPVHGNFLDLRRILALQLQPGQERRRLWTMFGNTFGSLSHEPDFVRDVSSCARTGDFLLLDVQLIHASAQDLDSVRKLDPALQHEPAEVALRWLSGPIYRHCRGVQDVEIQVGVTNLCPMPGSYELQFTAKVTSNHADREFGVFRSRRYDLGLLSQKMEDLGWSKKLALKYGRGDAMAVLLAERK